VTSSEHPITPLDGGDLEVTVTMRFTPEDLAIIQYHYTDAGRQLTRVELLQFMGDAVNDKIAVLREPVK
jgi:hypothetical protein